MLCILLKAAAPSPCVTTLRLSPLNPAALVLWPPPHPLDPPSFSVAPTYCRSITHHSRRTWSTSRATARFWRKPGSARRRWRCCSAPWPRSPTRALRSSCESPQEGLALCLKRGWLCGKGGEGRGRSRQGGAMLLTAVSIWLHRLSRACTLLCMACTPQLAHPSGHS